MSAKILWVRGSVSENNETPTFTIMVGPANDTLEDNPFPVPPSDEFLPAAHRRALAEWLDLL